MLNQLETMLIISFNGRMMFLLAGNDATSHQGIIMDFEEYRILLSRIGYLQEQFLCEEINHGRVLDMIIKIRDELEAVYPDHYEQFNNWR